MKKLLSMLLIGTMAFSIAGCTKKEEPAPTPEAPAEAVAPEEDMDTLVMAINATFPPFESIDEANPGQFVGIDIDIANHIADKLGVKLEINDMQFSALVPTMTSGRADIIISGLSPTEERLKVVDFSDPYFFPVNAIISAKDAGYTSLETLEGKKIGVSLGTSYANVAKTVANAEVLELDSTPLVIQEILAGRCDAGIFDATQAAEFCKQNEGLELNIIPSEIAFADTFAIALPKGSKYLDEINQILAGMKDDGYLNQILVKHLGEEAAAQYQETVSKLEIAQ